MNHRINEKIKVPKVQVIGPNGENLGIMDTREALRLASEYGLDLVEIAPNASPPVAKIMDYGKFLYQMKKKEKSKSKTPQTREIEMSPNIGEHDLNVKIRKIKEFLSEGDRVKVIIRMKGRQTLYTNLAEEMAQRVISLIKDAAIVDKEPVVEEKQVYFLVRPKR